VHRVSLVPGDGIGPEVTAATRAVLEASGAPLEFETAVIGQEAEKTSGAQMPPEVWESFARTKLLLKGPTYTPFGGSFRVKIERPGADGTVKKGDYPSLAIALRKELGLYVNVRPIKRYPNVPSRYDNVDLVIFRENSEDLYVGNERMIDADTAEGVKRITRGATERTAKFAYDYMKKVGRRKMTIGHKSNVMKMTDGLWLRVAEDVGKGYPGITTDARVIDGAVHGARHQAETFDGLLLTNLYGDIVSDLCAGPRRRTGRRAGANIGEDVAMFEACTATAPDIAGKDLANPMAMILSGVLMLRHIEETDAADRIDAALSQVLAEKKAITRDLGGTAGTKAFTQAIVEKLKG
jgi:isocitrate dehydrogenase (NAD+)